MQNRNLTVRQLGKNTTLIFVLLLMTLTQAGIVMYIPSFVKIAENLHISQTLVKTTLIAHLLGYGVSQLIVGPLTDSIPRKKLLVTSLSLFAFSCLWSFFSTSYISLLLSRTLEGLGSGGCIVQSRALLRIIYNDKQYIKVASIITIGSAIGFTITPLISGQLLEFYSWHAQFLLLFCASLIILGIVYVRIPDSFPTLRQHSTLHQVIARTTWVYGYAIKNRHFICYLIMASMVYGIVVAYATITPSLFERAIHISSYHYGWITAMIGIAYFIGAVINFHFVSKTSTHTMILLGIIVIIVSGIVTLLGYVVWKNTLTDIIFIPLSFAFLGHALVWPNCMAGALKNYLASAGATAAGYFSFCEVVFSVIISTSVAGKPDINQIFLGIVITALGIIASATYLIWRTLERHTTN